jgi:hypothetical protein
MSILYNRTAFYEPSTGIVYILKDGQLRPQAIQFSDSEADMVNRQFPTTVKVGYVEVLRQQTLRILNSFYGLGRFTLELSLVPDDPAFGPFKFTFKATDNPTVEFSVAQLAYAFNQDPANYTQLRRYVIDRLSVAGYEVS